MTLIGVSARECDFRERKSRGGEQVPRSFGASLPRVRADRHAKETPERRREIDRMNACHFRQSRDGEIVRRFFRKKLMDSSEPAGRISRQSVLAMERREDVEQESFDREMGYGIGTPHLGADLAQDSARVRRGGVYGLLESDARFPAAQEERLRNGHQKRFTASGTVMIRVARARRREDDRAGGALDSSVARDLCVAATQNEIDRGRGVLVLRNAVARGKRILYSAIGTDLRRPHMVRARLRVIDRVTPGHRRRSIACGLTSTAASVAPMGVRPTHGFKAPGLSGKPATYFAVAENLAGIRYWTLAELAATLPPEPEPASNRRGTVDVIPESAIPLDR
ncbi:MAG TPA: hypothetical protein VEK11_26530 [Thermoanaerobaculia bacterium]|nr:hypothetical protein [Thermoanaerobaculia bacterium]